MQLVAFAAAKVFVIDPGAHAAQAVEDMPLNWPAAHAVQLEALTAANVFVVEPGGQSAHTAVDARLYRPTAHGVQLIAPRPVLNISMTCTALSRTYAK